MYQSVARRENLASLNAAIKKLTKFTNVTNAVVATVNRIANAQTAIVVIVRIIRNAENKANPANAKTIVVRKRSWFRKSVTNVVAASANQIVIVLLATAVIAQIHRSAERKENSAREVKINAASRTEG